MSAIGKLSMAMLTSFAQPRLKANAAETRNLVPLLPLLCEENATCIASMGRRGVHMRLCCQELVHFYAILDREPRQMTSSGLAELQTCMSRYLCNWKAMGGHCVFKHHCAFHLVERASWMGNPKLYWTYADEAENRLMKSVAQSLHGGCTFYMSFLQKVLPGVVV